MLRLHGFFNSSAAYRVRIALNLKGLAFESIPVNLRAAEQRTEAFLALNPAGLVPTLEHDGMRISQSLAIIDYLDRQWPQPRLIPQDDPERSLVLQISLLVACDIHPLNNLRVLKYLTGPLRLDQAQKNTWYAHWIAEGFAALEKLLEGSGPYCAGSHPTLADCCLVPQVANALRTGCDLSPYPAVRRIHEYCIQQEAFRKASPNQQPDFVPA